MIETFGQTAGSGNRATTESSDRHSIEISEGVRPSTHRTNSTQPLARMKSDIRSIFGCGRCQPLSIGRYGSRHADQEPSVAGPVESVTLRQVHVVKDGRSRLLIHVERQSGIVLAGRPRIHDEPDVAETHGSPVVLELDRQQLGRFRLAVARLAGDGDLFLHGVPVVPDRDSASSVFLPLTSKRAERKSMS